MALKDEEYVEEWLRRQGYATTSRLAVKAVNPKNKGRKEIDLLAIHVGRGELLHVEVQSSPKPSTYLGRTTPLDKSVRKYIADKFDHWQIQERRKEWCEYQGFEVMNLKMMLVYQNLKAREKQVEVLEKNGIKAVSIYGIIRDLEEGDLKKLPFKFHSEADDNVTLFRGAQKRINSQDEMRTVYAFLEEVSSSTTSISSSVRSYSS